MYFSTLAQSVKFCKSRSDWPKPCCLIYSHRHSVAWRWEYVNEVSNLERLNKVLQEAGFKVKEAELRWIPTNTLEVSDRPLREGYSVGYSGEIVQGMSGGGIFFEDELIGLNGRSAHPILSNGT